MRSVVMPVVAGALLLVAAMIVIAVVRDGRPAEAKPPALHQSGEPLDSETLAAPAAAPAAKSRPQPVQAEVAERTVLAGPPRVEAALPFRGRVVDAATGEPVAHATVVAGRLEATVGTDGRWSADWPLPPELETIEFHNPVQHTHIRSVPRAELEPRGDAWLARIAIGPTYHLQIIDPSERAQTDWRARLVERLEFGAEIRGSWIKLHPAVAPALPFFRYDNPWEPNAAGSSFRIDVRSSGGLSTGSSGRIVSAVGIYPDVVTVRIDRQLAVVRGRVVNVAEEPIQRARVILVPLGAAASTEEAGRWPEAHSDGDGVFGFAGITPGGYRVQVRPRRGETPQSRVVELLPGANRLEDFVFPVQEGAGMIEGKLVSRRGDDFDHREIVRLRAVDGRDFEILDISSPGGRIQAPYRRGVRAYGEEGEHVFEFNEVPAGRYELSVVPQDGYRWTPETATVQPPNDELVFYREDDVPHRLLTLHVFDASSGERIERFTVQHQLGATWNAEARELSFGGSIGPFPAGSPWRLTVHAPGFQPHWIQGPRLETSVLRVELTPGFGVRLIARDLGDGLHADDPDGRLAAASRPPVAGARIYLGERLVGETDATGTAVLMGALDREEPIRIEPPPGWRRVASTAFRDGILAGPARDVVVWLTRE